jgi:glycosyltransferase involved in cell wall biosynthesis
MDTLVYPVPGTDKTCRTVREAMASGVPVIAPKTGFLPELITDGKNGRIIGFTSQSLSETLEDIIICKAKLGNMADMAYKTAHEKFSPLLRAEKTLTLYNTLLTKNAITSKSGGAHTPSQNHT